MCIEQSAIIARLAIWAIDKEILSTIRHKVFINEQNVPEEMEWDEYDASSTHYLATTENKVLAVARLKPDGQLGRMAVLAEYRNQGIGSKLLEFILQDIKQKNLTGIYLHAQVSAMSFYKKQGFVEYGKVFNEANIPHQKMLLAT